MAALRRPSMPTGLLFPAPFGEFPCCFNDRYIQFGSLQEDFTILFPADLGVADMLRRRLPSLLERVVQRAQQLVTREGFR